MENLEFSPEQVKLMQDTAKEVIESALKEKGFDKVDAKHRIDPTQEEMFKALKPEQRLHKLLSGIRNQDKEIIKAIAVSNETTAEDGGFFVPPDIDYAIQTQVQYYSKPRELFTTMPLGKSTTHTSHKMTSGVSVGWYDEGAAISTTKATFGKIDVSVKKLGAITILTNELLADSNTNLGTFLTEQIGIAVGKEEGRVALSGVANVDPFTGLFNQSGMTTTTLGAGKTNYSDIDYDSIVDVFTSIVDASNATWLVPRGVLNVLMKIKSSTNEPILSINAPIPNIFGRPYLILEDAPAEAAGATALLFGNWKKNFVYDKAGAIVSLTDSGTISVGQDTINLWQTDQSAIKYTKRVGFGFHAFPAEFGKLKLAAA